MGIYRRPADIRSSPAPEIPRPRGIHPPQSHRLRPPHAPRQAQASGDAQPRRPLMGPRGMNRRYKCSVHPRPMRRIGLCCRMHRHRQRQSQRLGLPRLRRHDMAQMHPVHAPRPRHIGPIRQHHHQPTRPRNPHQPPRQPPAFAARQAIVAQQDSASHRQMGRQGQDRIFRPFIAEQPDYGHGPMCEGVALNHRPFYRRKSDARNA